MFRQVPKRSPVHTLLTRNNTDARDGFITHLDHSPVRKKVYVFLIPLASNLLFAGIVIWRTFVFFILLGHLIRPQSAWNVPWQRYISTLSFDVVIFTQLPPILFKFAAGHLLMRLRYGFRPVEIVFRKPTGALRSQVDILSPQEQTAYIDSMAHALDPRLLYNTVGYNTRDGFWELEYKAAIDAYRLAQTGEVPIEAWDFASWQRIEGKWTVLYVLALHEPIYTGRAMELVMQKLRSLGRQDLVNEWLANLQSQDLSHFTLQDKDTLEELLANAGISVATLWSEALDELQSTQPMPF